MQTWQKYHHDETRGVENSHASFGRHDKLRRISIRTPLARRAHTDTHQMDGIGELRAEMITRFEQGIGELRAEMIAGIAELRTEMIARFEQVDRRLDESFAAITQQFVEQRAYTDFAYERLDRADQTLRAGIVRLERKLDRILALVVESSRTRLR